LHNISVAGSQVTDRSLQKIARLQSLVSIDLSDTAISDDGAKYFGQSLVINSISLAGTRVTATGINEILKTRFLNKLDLSRLNLTDTAMSEIGTWQCGRLLLSGNPITDASLERLNHAVGLDLSHTAIKGVGFEKLASVQWLKLDGTAVDDDAILKLLKNNSVIQRLSLRNTQVTITSLKAMVTAQLVLNRLELGDGLISPEDLIASGYVPSMQLALNAKKFDCAMFAHKDVTMLTNVSSLKRLSLAGCDLTEKSLAALSSLRLLEIDLTNTKVMATEVLKYFDNPGGTTVYLSIKQCTEEERSHIHETPQLRIGRRLTLEE
jgi:hypothetical protein